MKRPSKRIVLISAVATLVLAGGGTALAAASSIPDASGVIHGCYSLESGQVRVIDTGAGQTCRNNETPLNWNQAGPQGPAGPAGPKGDPGPAGAGAPVDYGTITVVEGSAPQGGGLGAYTCTGTIHGPDATTAAITIEPGGGAFPVSRGCMIVGLNGGVASFQLTPVGTAPDVSGAQFAAAQTPLEIDSVSGGSVSMHYVPDRVDSISGTYDWAAFLDS